MSSDSLRNWWVADTSVSGARRARESQEAFVKLLPTAWAEDEQATEPSARTRSSCAARNGIGGEALSVHAAFELRSMEAMPAVAAVEATAVRVEPIALSMLLAAWRASKAASAWAPCSAALSVETRR